MLDTNFSIIDYLVFSSLLIASSLIGVYFWFKSRKNGTNDEFLTGNRRLSLFPTTLSLIASFMSTNTLLGLPAEVYQVGTQISMQIISMVITIVLTAEVFMPVYYDLGFVSVNEYLAKRFDAQYMRITGTIGFLLSTVPYMAVVLYGPALALSSVTPLSISASILVVGFICTFYTTIGGIKAVIWTDVLQCILMFLGVFVVIIQGLVELGGFSRIWEINEMGGRLKFFNMQFDIYNHNNLFNVVLGTTLIWCSSYCVSQTQVQRYCNMGSKKNAKLSLYTNLPGLIILCLMATFSGMIIYAKYHACDPVTLGLINRHDQLMPYYVMDTLSKYPGVPGLFVACVFSGSLSTLSSGFNSLAAITWEDLLKDRINVKSEAQALNITKFIAMSYGLLSIGFSFVVGNAGTVMQASMALTGAMSGPIFALFLIGLFVPWATAPGSLIGFICGFGVSAILAIGSLVIPRPKVSLSTTIDSCPHVVLMDVLNRFSALPTSSYLPSYDNVEGYARFFHISYLLVSPIGFTICLVVGMVASLCIGRRIKNIDPRLMSPMVRFMCRKQICEQLKSNDAQFGDGIDVTNQTNHEMPQTFARFKVTRV